MDNSFAFEDFLDNTTDPDSSGLLGAKELLNGSESGESSGRTKHFFELGYDGAIDYRIRQLSYSSAVTLHNCPKKFELYKRRTTQRSSESEESTITFAYGHCFGLGIQLVLEDKSWEEIVFRLFLEWKAPLFAVDEKRNKSFWTVLLAIEKFIALQSAGLLADYELVYYDGKPATELSFCIVFPDGFRYRGFVDAVLRHKSSGEILVLECKTTWSRTVNPAQYKNSGQALGYSIVLDVLFPELSSYKVLYFVYVTTSKEFITLPFDKTYLQRALWIKELLLDIEMIKLYERDGVYPMHGESCYSFGRECEYLQTCTLNVDYLTKPCSEKDMDKTVYQVNISLLDLLESQLSKGENHDSKHGDL